MDPRGGESSQQQSPTTIQIALLGVTGAGKTTFAQLASGRDDLKIGHGVDPCTQRPQAITFELNGRRITLIDTPGFDDDMRSDVEVLEDIARWMTKKGHLRQKLLDGLIFLHPITLNRVGGSERRRTRLLEKILGPGAYKRVIIATTMWEVLSADYNVERRLRGRTGAGGVWHDMTFQGASLLKHSNTRESAHRIIQMIVDMADRSGVVETQLQIELRTNKNRINDTAVGRELKSQLEMDIALLKQELAEHRRNCPLPLSPRQQHSRKRPPRQGNGRKTAREKRGAEDNQRGENKVDDIQRKEERSEQKKEMDDWRMVEREINDRLENRTQQLKRLDGLGARLMRFVSSLFGG